MATPHLSALPLRAQLSFGLYRYMRFWANWMRELQYDMEEDIQEMFLHREIVGDNLQVAIHNFDATIREGDRLEWARDYMESEWWLVVRESTKHPIVSSLSIWVIVANDGDGYSAPSRRMMEEP
jgi:hypothetical protein